MTHTHTLTSKGQVTLPKLVRERLGVKPGDKVTFSFTADNQLVVSRSMTIEEVHEMLKHPAGAKLSAKEKMVLEGMEKDGHKAFRAFR